MSIFSLEVGVDRSADWLFVAIVLSLAYIIAYPVYLYFLRYQHARRIKNQLVTSSYKLPTDMTPNELAYIFSTRTGTQQLYAELLHLANHSILILHRKAGRITVEMGPKLPGSLSSPEDLLIGYVREAEHPPVPIHRIIDGTASQTGPQAEKITGKRTFVFRWLLRQHLRERKIIKTHMTGLYARLLLDFSVVNSLILALVSLGSYRFLGILLSGKVDMGLFFKHEINAIGAWLMLLPFVVVIGFFMLRLRGRLLGRHWLLTPAFRHYTNQLIAFKEFVRLAHKGVLRFESKELEKETLLRTKPYAIALGMIEEKL